MARTPARPLPYHRSGRRMTDELDRPGWRLKVWDPRARRQRETIYYGTEDGAVAEMARLRDEARQAQTPAAAGAHRVTVADLALAFLKRYAYKVPPAGRQPGVKRPRATWENTRDVAKAYVVPALGEHTPVRLLTYKQIESAIAGLELVDGRTPASPATKQKAASVVRRMMTYAVKEGILQADPSSGLPTVWGEGTRTVVIPSLVQVEALAAAMDEEWPGRGDLIRAFAFLGVRWSEMRRLRWDDVDIEARTIRVRGTKTTDADRYVLILDQAIAPLEGLRELARRCRDAPWVMPGERGGPLTASLWRKHLRKARTASGVEYTAHKLRHVCASLLIAAGATPEQVREQMGHSTTQVTQRVYRHAWQMNRRDVARRLSRAVTGIEAEDYTADEDEAA